MEITVWVWYWHYFSLCATEAAYLLPNANESSDAESWEGWEKGAEICTHIWLGKSNNAPTIQSNPIQSSPIQSGRQKKAETPPILSGFLTRLFFVLGKGFLFLFLFFFLFLPWFIKTFTSNYSREMGVWTLQKSHPLITVIYLPNRRKLFHFDWSSQGAIKQNPRNAKWKVKSVGKGSEPQNKGHKNEAKKGKRQE